MSQSGMVPSMLAVAGTTVLELLSAGKKWFDTAKLLKTASEGHLRLCALSHPQSLKTSLEQSELHRLAAPPGPLRPPGHWVQGWTVSSATSLTTLAHAGP